jgi:preprotein translocase subunit SecD
MKTILYFLIAIFIFGIIATGFTKKADSKISILIQSIDNTISPEDLSQSAKIISDRLKDFSSEKFNVSMIPGKSQIQVTITNKWDLKAVKNLIIQKGNLEFYETYNHEKLSEFLNQDNQLFSLLNVIDTDNQGAKIGCTTAREVERVNAYLNSLGLNKKCKFAWSQYAENSEVCLFALKTGMESEPLLTNDDIEIINYCQDKKSESYNIEIRFKKPAAELWSVATKSNINNAIAIVSDNNVICAPVVKSEIINGMCEIAGNFSQIEAKYFVALINNGELTVNFKIVK